MPITGCHVSAAAALLLSAGITPANVTTVLTGTARDLGPAGYDTTYGWGLLDIQGALSTGLNDVTPPAGTISINDGALWTNARLVTLAVTASDATSNVVAMSFTNDGSTFSDWETVAATKSSWDLTVYGGTTSEGVKTVTARFKDAAGNIGLVSATISLDQTAPAAPPLTAHPASAFSARDVQSNVPVSATPIRIAWNDPDDASGIQGYRIAYTPNETADFSGVAISTDRSFTTNAITSSRVVYLHMVAVDGAGNPSALRTFIYRYQAIRLVSSDVGGGSIAIHDADGKLVRRLKPFGAKYSGGFDVEPISYRTGKPDDLLVVPHVGSRTVKIITLEGKLLKSYEPFGTDGERGMSAAVVDFNGDGRDDLIIGQRTGGSAVRILSSSGKRLREFWPFGKGSTDGVKLAAAMTIDGPIVVAVKTANGATVRTYDRALRRLRQFAAFPGRPSFGLAVAANDVTGDGVVDIVVAPTNGAAHVRVFSLGGRLTGQFFALPKSFRGGVDLAVGDVEGDGRDEIIAIPAHGAAQARIFRADGTLVTSFFTFPKTYHDGASVAAI